MRHQVDGRKFGRNTSHRVAMLRNLAISVIEKEQVVTTVQKAKEARRVVDRLITLGKKGTDHARRLAFDRTRNDLVVGKLFTTLAERYKTRSGGYTRVLKMADRRWGDAAEMAVLELVDHAEIDRRRKRKGPAAAAEGSEGAAPAAKDPFSRFRKLFRGKEGGGKAAGGKAKGGATRSAAGRKAPASGGNKSGGSS